MIFTKRNTIVLCLFVWLAVYLIELPNHVGWGDLRFSDLFFLCTFANHVHSYALFYVLFGIFIPLSSSFLCYLLIYLKVKDSSLTRNRILYSDINRGGSSSTSKSNSNADESTEATGCISLSQKFFDDLKIIQVLFRVQIIYTVMWLPLMLLILAHQTTSISYVWYILAILSAHGNSAINCMVYAASIDHFREGYKRLLGWNLKHPRTSSRQNVEFKKARDKMRKEDSRTSR
jgi:7 transmembrane receptor (rhodopsin family)